MKCIQVSMLFCSAFFLTDARVWDDGHPKAQNHTGDRRTYAYTVTNGGSNGENIHMSFTDNSIRRQNLNVQGNLVIGNTNVSEGVYGQNNNWSYERPAAGNGVYQNPQNVRTSYTGYSIDRDNANLDRTTAIRNNQVHNETFSQSIENRVSSSGPVAGTSYMDNSNISNRNFLQMSNSTECSYVDGVIYENGQRRAASPAEKEMAKQWGEEMTEWGRRYSKHIIDKISQIFGKAVETGPEPKAPTVPCFCSPYYCQSNSSLKVDK